ncbi:putative alpha/beta-hydrolase family hydrolase [Rheinheimera pacifica]|uniref:alpha/beta family hydrolase n=1 Tax=Rheinheimera pacifica TaxID=173990 RepID=UPI002857E57C|nr:alpha/beta family hydrolase [Rheinheimera pacifica]MDR6981402.1 putative alpha/beta-hydrolase family hydrolase [Rheinheimera pacifica]
MPLPLTKVLITTAAAVKARLLLAHGAGAGADSSFMQQLAQQLALNNVEVWRFNFAYMQRFIDTGKRSLPEKMPLLMQQFSLHADNCPTDLPLFIGGKSMGGRVASMLGQTSMLDQNSSVKAIFAFGYPFHAPKKLSWRTEHFTTLACPLFIAQGERDAFGTKAELAAMQWPKVDIHWLADGDHDYKPRVKSGLTQQQLIAAAAQFCSRNIDEILLAAK